MALFYKTPAGTAYNLYLDMLKQPHLLIAGATGSGKSVAVNGLIYTALYNAPNEKQLILIDPKRVELAQYKRLQHCIKYASEPKDMINALKLAMDITEQRYKRMQKRGLRKSTEADIYVIIDELADLMTTNKKEIQPLIQRLCQIGRAAGVHVIACTQCPLSSVIPTPIKVNFDARLGLRTRSAQDSRNIMGFAGCETLPRYGQGYYMSPDINSKVIVPYYDDETLQERIKYWMRQTGLIHKITA